MLGISQPFPDFSLKSVISSNLKDGFPIVSNETYKSKWTVFFFWPKDFTFVCHINRELSCALGILHPTEGVSQRATYIVDPDGIIRFVMVTDLNVGRSVKEVLRVLDALQTNELCPCEWGKGDKTIKL